MPRNARLDYPGALQHVTLRGIERRAVFHDDEDRSRFVRRLERVLLEEGVVCLAWALMTNHVHLLLRTGPAPLARVMARLGTGYAVDFNRRHDRAGHLFQNRYHSRLVADESHMVNAVRYVHLNPVQAGIVPDLEALDRYPWTGHRALMGHAECRFLDAPAVLSLFSDDPMRARQLLRSFMAEGVGTVEPPPGAATLSATGQDERTADPEGCAPAPSGKPGNSGSRIDDDSHSLANALRLEGWDLGRLVREVCLAMDVPEEDLLAGRRTRTVAGARAAIAWMATARLGMRQADIAEPLRLRPSALSECLRRGREETKGRGLERLFDSTIPG